MRPIRRTLASFLPLAWVANLAFATPGAAQQRCDLQINAPVRSSVSSEEAGGAYTHYLGGGTITLRCGGAVMTGDSAVHHEAEERAEMIGDVSYRDRTRTLSARRLDYYETSSRVVATGDVELVRLATGARLRGPRVTFLRGLGAGGRTLATGRPHMTVPPSPGRGNGEPMEVDADETEFIGEDLALARGDVVIERSDFDATADSARFEEELGRLYGRPRLKAEGARMEGDSIHALLADEGIERLRAFGDARVTGESVRMAGDEIDVRWAEGQIGRIEVFGAARSLAGGETFLIAGDSLDVAFTAGRPDSVTAVGTGRTFQLEAEIDSSVPLSEPAADMAGGASWVQGDSVRVWLDPAAAGSDASREAGIRRLKAVGNARSFFAAVRDTARSPRESRNYILGAVVDIRFEEGEPVGVTAEQAIGVYLEPSDETVPAAGRTSAGEAP